MYAIALQDWQRSESMSREKSVREELSVDTALSPEVLCIPVVVLGRLKHTGNIDSQRQYVEEMHIQQIGNCGKR
jgi:hypothetical protein